MPFREPLNRFFASPILVPRKGILMLRRAQSPTDRWIEAKGTNLALHSPQELRRVQDELNGRPRKRHGWATPEARLAALQCRNE